MKLIAFRSFNFMGLHRASELIIVVMQGFDTAATETQNILTQSGRESTEVSGTLPWLAVF
jgi:hypothetical protein